MCRWRHKPRRRQKNKLKSFAAGLLMISLAVPTAFATDAMPVAQQNALVQKYCAVCHTDAAKDGALSLPHFDAIEW